MKPIKVLIIEDSEDDEMLLLRHLKREGCEVQSERVESATEVRNALAEKQWDIIISDNKMPNFSGMEAHRILEESGIDIPFIIVSGSIGEETAVKAMLAGVSDYLMKDNIARLVPAIERELKSAKDRREQRKTEKALKESAERYRNLFENANDTIYTIDLDGNYTSINKNVEELTGFSREEILQGNFNSKLKEKNINKIRELLDNKDFADETRYELKLKTKDGNKKIVEVNSRLIYKDGKPSEIEGIARDVTERKKVENDLRESVEDFHALVEATGQIVWTIKDGKRDEEFLEFWANLTGQTSEESDDKGWLDVIHPEDRENLSRSWEKAYINKTQWNSVYRVLTVSEKYNYYSVRGIPIFYKNGTFRKWIGTFSDITARKEVEEELRQSEARLQLSQQVGRVGTWEWNIKTNELIWSDVIWSFYDLEPDAITLTYENWKKMVHPDDIEYIEGKLAEAIDGKDVIDLEFRGIKNEGQIVWIASKGSVIRKKTGEVERLIGINTDITERKTAEENLYKSEEKLRQAQKLESIGRLAGGIAHDFNNMLTAINGYSGLILRRMRDDDQLRGFVEEIKKSGERSALLTQQLLAFSRRQMLQPKVLNLNNIVSDTTEMLKRLIGEDIDLVENFSDDIGMVKADPGQITQVIMNLAVNSRDAMPKGGTLTIGTKNVYLDKQYVEENPWLTEGNYVLLKVSDTGTGIDDEIMENIFEPFFTTKEVGSGTGLGLATVYGIIKQSGGYINVQSKINVGTTFEIYLPRIEVPGVSVEKTDSPENLLMGTETILLVEDEEMVRRLTREILESYGYKIIEAGNGEEALEIYEKGEHKFDLLISDVVMPKMGGYELAEKLLKNYPQMRILFTSGYNKDPQIDYDSIDATTDFIHKPFTLDDLARKVRKILDIK